MRTLFDNAYIAHSAHKECCKQLLVDHKKYNH